MDISKGEKMKYTKMAYIYDELMKDTPYNEWIRFTENIVEKYKLNPNKILDLGCGTGNISIPLSAKGYRVVGVDISEDMLAVANEKIIANNQSIQLLQQDMKELELLEPVDLVISYIDSINYLNGLEEVKQTFKQVSKNLNSNGYFVFDLHSPYKLTNLFNNQTFAWNDEEISVIWLTDVDEEGLTVEHDLTFFVENAEGHYEKFNEIHMQQTYTIDTIKAALSDADLTLVDTYSNFNLSPVSEESERIFYIAKK